MLFYVSLFPSFVYRVFVCFALACLGLPRPRQWPRQWPRPWPRPKQAAEEQTFNIKKRPIQALGGPPGLCSQNHNISVMDEAECCRNWELETCGLPTLANIESRVFVIINRQNLKTNVTYLAAAPEQARRSKVYVCLYKTKKHHPSWITSALF